MTGRARRPVHPLRRTGLDHFYLFVSIVGPLVVLVLVVFNVGPFG